MAEVAKIANVLQQSMSPGNTPVVT